MHKCTCTGMLRKRIPWKAVLNWSAPQTTGLHWCPYPLCSFHLLWLHLLPPSTFHLCLPSWVSLCVHTYVCPLSFAISFALISFFPFLSSFSFHSLSPIISPLLGISGSISFKAHVKGTVCHFQRPLCPAFLSLNLVSPKHFPIAWLSRPLFSQLPLAFHSLLSRGSSSCPKYILPKMIYISHGYFFCNLTVFVLFLKHAH